MITRGKKQAPVKSAKQRAKPVAVAKKAAAIVKAICLTPKCGNKEHSRGLCHACLHDAYASIRANEVTEEKLIAAGLMAAPKKPGRRIQPGKFEAALKKVK